MALTTVPGGIAEMCISAKVMQSRVPLVTVTHGARMPIRDTSTALPIRLAERLNAA